jgi:hypothetical protein
VAAFGDGITGRRTISALLAASEGHPELLAASARAALALGPRALAALAPRLRASLRSDPDGQTVSVEAAALLVGPAGLSANQLAAAAERGRWWAPLAALRLAANDSKQVRPRLERLLGGSDPLVRQHVALGLGLSPEKSAVSLLTEAYRTEPEPSVRRAIVRALSRRREVRRLRTLRLARDLDPDSSVRALARTALAGRRLDVLALAPGRDVAWIVLRPNDPSERAAAVRAALLTRAGLPALPAMADPDAVLLVPGARDTHEHALRLAPARASDQP